MNSNSLRTLRGQLLREVITLLLFASLTLQTMQAAAPGWWAVRGVLTPGAPQDDYSVANLGQLKNIASKAAQELDENLLTGAGEDIHALLDDWNAAPLGGTTRDDYAALTLGQLKKVAKLFYDRLADVYVCPAGIYPWSGSNAADDYAVANVGQLKAVFAFDTSPADVNDNGIPDLWETTMFCSLDQDMDADFDGDGLSNREEWAAGTSAVSEDSDGDDFSDKVELDHGYDPASRAIYPGQVSYQLADLSYRMEHAVTQWPDNADGQHEWHVNKYIDMPNNVDYKFNVVTGEKPAFPPLPPVPTHADFEFPYWNSFYNGSVCRIYKLHTQSEFDEHRVIGGTLARVRAVSECASLKARTCYLLLKTSSWAINTNDAPELEESSVVTVTIPAQTTQSNTYEATLEPMEGRQRITTATPLKMPEILRDIAGGIEAWTPLAGEAARALPGQKINLKLDLPDGISATDFHWSMTGGKFKDYPEPKAPPIGAHQTPFSASDFTGQKMHFYWSQTGKQTFTVNCLINGTRQYFRGSIDVVTPNCTFTGIQKAIRIAGFNYDDRFDWTASVGKLPSDFPDGGKWMFVQNICVTQSVIPSNGPSKINENNGEWCLDALAGMTQASYGRSGEKNDGESNSAFDTPFGSASNDVGNQQLDQEFNTYVMFKSKEVDACWVPLKMIKWRMGFKASVSSLFGNLDIQFNDSYPKKDLQLIGTETHVLPEWSKIGSFLLVPSP